MLRDPKQYQVVINGKELTIDQLNAQQLQEELMKMMDLVEEIDCKSSEISRLIQSWRSSGYK